MTQSTLAVLRVFLEDLGQARYGLEITRESGVKSGTLYPVLDRLEEAGWIEGSWEDREPSEVKRPRRRLYRLTPSGAVAATHAVEAAGRRLIPSSWQPGWTPS